MSTVSHHPLFKTQYEYEKKATGNSDTPEEFYAKWYKVLTENTNTDKYLPTFRAKIGLESLWYKAGRPVYRLWPLAVDVLANVRIDHIPCDLVTVPYDAFFIGFPKTCSDPLAVRSVGVAKSRIKGGPFLFLVDNGESLLATWCKIGFDNMKTAIDAAEQEMTSVEEAERARKAIAIATNVCLLATRQHHTSEPWIERDVLSRLVDRYDSAKTEEEREKIVDKSIRNGVNGFRIGRKVEQAVQRERGLGLTYNYSNQEGAREDAQDRTSANRLKYSHFRSAHWHLHWVGHGSERKLEPRFHCMIQVKPDLPLKQLA